jgi:hypothetical protein
MALQSSMTPRRGNSATLLRHLGTNFDVSVQNMYLDDP